MEDEFQLVSVTGFMKHNGGIWFKEISRSEYQFKATVQEFHLNPGGITHGGFISSLMDSGMGTSAHRSLGQKVRAATISLDVKFIAGSTTGDVLLGTAKILRKTRSLVFVHGELTVKGKVVASAEGIWKLL
ncbi:MAG: PaaI family thioesterase [Desulfobulbaceae bacterium]|nr:PaaI family thioesterase [Desulfobulbaceae bacterium]